MFLPRTRRPLDRYLFESLPSSLQIELEVVAQRVLRDVHFFLMG